MILNNRLDNYFFVSVDRQTFLGFEMTSHLHDTLDPLNLKVRLGWGGRAGGGGGGWGQL